MKNKGFLISCIILTLLSQTQIYAYQSSGDRMAQRCGDGMVNLMVAPLDVLNHMEHVRYNEGVLPALTYGTIRGVSGALTRAAFGVYKMVTFYVPEENSLQYEPHFDSALFRLAE
ncbi:hypothetical protein ACFL3D_03160 [Candidatus Omnitrophota bacterium]